MKTRVLVIVDTLAAGGAERLAVEAACALDRSQFAVHVVATRSTGPLARVLEAAHLPYSVLGKRSRFDLRAWRRLRNLATHADLLHTHKFGSNVWGALLARRTGVALVAHEHNFSGDASRVHSLVDRHWIAPAARAVICVSDSVAAQQRAGGVPAHKLCVVPNAVHVDRALPRCDARDELGLSHDATVVGIVGRLRPEKGHDVALRAFALLREHHADALLCVVGDGPERARLQALASELGITAGVHWAGERRDAARIASAFDLALLSSHWEGLPLAALEALAAGVPLVATAVGGLVQLGDAGAARLVAPGDAPAMAAALRDLLDDPAAAAALDVAGRRRIDECHAFPRLVHELELLYLRALGREVARPHTTGDAAEAA